MRRFLCLTCPNQTQKITSNTLFAHAYFWTRKSRQELETLVDDSGTSYACLGLTGLMWRSPSNDDACFSPCDKRQNGYRVRFMGVGGHSESEQLQPRYGRLSLP